MVKKGQEIIFESFENRKLALGVGFFCLLYLISLFLPDNQWIARVLPPWSHQAFGIFSIIAFAGQALAWKLFKHYYPKWYLQFPNVILFICEFGLLLFSLLFFSWPVYWIVQFFTAKPHL